MAAKHQTNYFNNVTSTLMNNCCAGQQGQATCCQYGFKALYPYNAVTGNVLPRQKRPSLSRLTFHLCRPRIAQVCRLVAVPHFAVNSILNSDGQPLHCCFFSDAAASMSAARAMRFGRSLCHASPSALILPTTAASPLTTLLKNFSIAGAAAG